MRKWMRERLQRRKKKATEEADQPSPPPLQPAYFDSDQPPGAAGESVREAAPASAPLMSAEEPSSGETEQPQSPDSPAPPLSSSSGSRGRGRRRRGGRGRTGRGREQAVAQAFSPARVKNALPDTQGSTVLEEQPPDVPEVEGELPPAAEVPKAPLAPHATQRPPKGAVVLAIGLPGSGKSSWFKRHNVVPLSSDSLRALLFDDVREQRFQDIVFSNLRSLLKARLIARRPMNYVDATNLTPQERQHWIKLAKDYNYEVHAVFFDVPVEVCIERHQRRDRLIPEDVMRRMAAKLKPPSFEEGFAKITVVRVKKKD
jgi:predicted kinase